MKCQIRFSRKNKKNSINLSSAEFAHSMVNVKLKLAVSAVCDSKNRLKQFKLKITVKISYYLFGDCSRCIEILIRW